MDPSMFYDLAKSLESTGYWKSILPGDSYSLLQRHLKSLDVWIPFFSISNCKQTNPDAITNPSSINEDIDIQATRKKYLGEDGMLSLRIRLLLLDISLYNVNIPQSLKMESKCPFFFDDMYYTLECDHEDWENESHSLDESLPDSTSNLPSQADMLIDATPSKTVSSLCQSTNSLNNSIDLSSSIEIKPQTVWSQADIEAFEEFYSSLNDAMTKIKGYEKHSYPFLKRVRKSEAPGYYDIIKNPIDLSAMTKKIKRREYNSKQDFQADLDLMFANCRRYNTDPKSIYVKHASELDKYSKKLLKKVKDYDCTEKRALMPPPGTPKNSRIGRKPKKNSVVDLSSSIDGDISPSPTRRRGRGRGRPKKVKLEDQPEIILKSTQSSDFSIVISESNDEIPTISKEQDDSISEDKIPSPQEPAIQTPSTTEEFLSEDLQVKVWRSQEMTSRLERMRASHIRDRTPFENWPIFERNPWRMKLNLDYYKTCQKRLLGSKSLNNSVSELVTNDTSNDSVDTQVTDIYLPEYNIIDGIPEIPVKTPKEREDDFVTMSSSVSLMRLQKSLVIILTQAGYHGANKVPFEVLIDLLASFFMNIAKEIQLNSLTDNIDIITLLLKKLKSSTSLEYLLEYSKTGNNINRPEVEKEIFESSLFDISSPSIDEIPLNVSQTFVTDSPSSSSVYYQNKEILQEEPQRKKMKLTASIDSPRKKRGRPKKRKTNSP